MSDPSNLTRELETLAAYLDGGEDGPTLRPAVRSVGSAGDASALSVLRRVARRSASTGRSKVAFDAVDALWRLGQDRSFFTEAAENHAENKWLAYQAIIVLGRLPGDAEVEALLADIKQAASDAHVLSAVALAARTRELDDEYGQLASIGGRLQFVLDTLRTDWNPITGLGGEVDLGTDPQATWAQDKIRELSADDPIGCASVVALARPPEVEGDAYLLPYREFLAQYLAEAAKEHFDTLVRADS